MKFTRYSSVLFLLVTAPLFAAPTITTSSFQQGTDGYTGSFDRKIGPAGAGDANGVDVNSDTTSFFIDGGGSALNDAGARHGLLSFDGILGGGIPAGAKIIDATIDMVTATVNDAQSGGAYNVYRLSTPFDGTSTWDGTFGGDGTLGDVAEIVGSFDRPANGAPVSARVDRAVESWLAGAPLNGFAIRSDRSTDGWSPNTTGAATVGNRPKLTVNYTLDANVEIARFQQGREGYSGTSDLRLDSAGTDVDGSTVQEVFLDGFDEAAASPDQSYLLKFDGLDLSKYQEIHRAELVMVTGFSSANADSGAPDTNNYFVHQVLRDWSTSSTYASFDSDGVPALNGPLELQSGGVIGPAATTATGMNDTELVHLDVTSIVENWRTGQTNYGFYIGTPSPADGGTANGWQIFTSGAADVSFRPELRIVGVLVPEPAAALLIVVGGMLLVSAVHRQR